MLILIVFQVSDLNLADGVEKAEKAEILKISANSTAVTAEARQQWSKHARQFLGFGFVS